MRWPNGYIPKDQLVIFNTGWNSIDGDWYWGLPASTYQKHLNLVARAKARTGRVLQISDGWGTYRPLHAQKIARQLFGNGAAYPGTSSHGGYWEGRDTSAIDYSNWSWVYSGDREAFFSDCRAEGLTPGMINPRRNSTYPDEPWHVIDLDPWATIGEPAESDSSPFKIPNTEEAMPQATVRAVIMDGLFRATEFVIAPPQRSFKTPVIMSKENPDINLAARVVEKMNTAFAKPATGAIVTVEITGEEYAAGCLNLYL